MTWTLLSAGLAWAQPTLEEAVGATDVRLLAELRVRDAEAAGWFEEAVEAGRRNDVDRALELYGRIRAKLPSWSPAPRRACGLLGGKSDHVRAIELCRQALAYEDLPDNRSALAMALLAPTRGKATPASVAGEALSLARLAEHQAPLDPFAMVALCLSGAAWGDDEVLLRCRDELERKLAPADTADTLALAAVLAFTHGDAKLEQSAVGLVERAVELAPERRQPLLARIGTDLHARSLARARTACAALHAAGPQLAAAAADCAATLAIRDERWDDAHIALDAAKAAGLDEARRNELARVLSNTEPWPRRYLVPLAWVAGAWLALAILLFVTGQVLSRLTLRAAARPPSPHVGAGVVGLVRSVRGLYRAVLALVCIYYYASIPILMGLVLAGAAGIVVAGVSLGRFPVAILVIVAMGAFVTVGALGLSLFRRRRHEEPGDPLDLAAQSRLRALLGEVAERIGTTPVDTVYLAGGTELAVFERGSLLRVARGKGERCLALGVATIGSLTVGDLRVVLAHEYGHFSNRDTAGGRVALAVRRSLVDAATDMAYGGAAGPLNPAWLFLAAFHRIFLRVSHGASRLQEVLADRHAALAYGSEAFGRALRKTVELGVRFEATLNLALEQALLTGVAPHNLYRATERMQLDAGDVHEAVAQALTRTADPYDSHPPPVDRIELARRLGAPPTPAADDDAPAWSLLDHRPELERRMSALIVERLNERGIRHVKIAAPRSAVGPKAQRPEE
ncbi:MAG: M48 family metallopeptidase [Polyangiaceae bacterium]|nr:M48 family metallopeptidase [Polyangiaceae bacterium]